MFAAELNSKWFTEFRKFNNQNVSETDVQMDFILIKLTHNSNRKSKIGGKKGKIWDNLYS